MSRYYCRVKGVSANITTKSGTPTSGLVATVSTSVLDLRISLRPLFVETKPTEDDMLSLHVNGYQVAYIKASELITDAEPRFALAKHLVELLLPRQKLELFRLLAPGVVLALTDEPAQ